MVYLYRDSGWRSVVINHVLSESGNVEDGEDVFQETVILFDRNIREGTFKGSSSLKTYFVGIAKQYWFNKRRSLKNHLNITDQFDISQTDTPELIYLKEERKSTMDTIIESLGSNCKEVLSLYKLSLSNEEIAHKLNLSSPEMAKKYTYRCREKLRTFLMKRKDLLSFFNVKTT